MQLFLYILAIAIAGFLLQSFFLVVKSACCRWHVRKYCRRHQLKIVSLTLDHAVFDLPGVLADLDCTDARNKCFFLQLCVTSFGVRDVLTKQKLKRKLNNY